MDGLSAEERLKVTRERNRCVLSLFVGGKVFFGSAF